jgi:hypothetical protein
MALAPSSGRKRGAFLRPPTPARHATRRPSPAIATSRIPQRVILRVAPIAAVEALKPFELALMLPARDARVAVRQRLVSRRWRRGSGRHWRMPRGRHVERIRMVGRVLHAGKLNDRRRIDNLNLDPGISVQALSGCLDAALNVRQAHLAQPVASRQLPGSLSAWALWHGSTCQIESAAAVRPRARPAWQQALHRQLTLVSSTTLPSIISRAFLQSKGLTQARGLVLTSFASQPGNNRPRRQELHFVVHR